MRETVSELEQLGYIEHGAAGRGTYWSIQPKLYNRLADDKQGLTNQEIRQITRFDRNQARRLMQELLQENKQLKKVGERRWARYEPSND